MLVQEVYVSAAVHTFSADDLAKLLTGSRVHNERAGITGMLLYNDGNFMQAVEGEEDAVATLMTRIRADVRHHRVMTLIRGPIERRQFPEWAMAFRQIDAKDAIAGYSDFLASGGGGTAAPADPGRALRLLQTFKASLR